MTAADFDDFGSLLRYLRRQARLTQRELGTAVGYSEAQISRLELCRRPPDPDTVAALFVPALRLPRGSTTGRRLVELAKRARRPAAVAHDLADIPPLPDDLVARDDVLTHLVGLLAVQRRVVVTGAPGVGKTTLVAAVARDLVATRAVCWVTLRPDVPPTVPVLLRRLATTLLRHGESCVTPVTRHPLTVDERLRLLTRGLARRPTLLCLDNGDLLAPAPAVRWAMRHLLLTTRLELLVAGRTDPRLPGAAVLPLPCWRPDDVHDNQPRRHALLPDCWIDSSVRDT